MLLLGDQCMGNVKTQIDRFDHDFTDMLTFLPIDWHCEFIIIDGRY